MTFKCRGRGNECTSTQLQEDLTATGARYEVQLMQVYLCLFLQGWYIITYALGIYYLNLLLAFLSPKIEPSYGMADDDDEDSGELQCRRTRLLTLLSSNMSEHTCLVCVHMYISSTHLIAGMTSGSAGPIL